MDRRCWRGAFTLVELLVSLTIVSALMAVGFSLTGVMKRKGMMAREIGAARNLMTAVHLYASDHNGQILPGYQSDRDAVNDDGEPLSAPANARYPWRLYPYIQDVESTLVFNGNEAVLQEQNKDYLVSVSPNLGMNSTFVGGHYGSGSLLRPSPRIEAKVGRFCARHTADSKAGGVIVFLSARSSPEEAWQGNGYFEVQPPQALGPIWSDGPWEVDAAPSQHGFVDLRWGGKAVAAFLDGSVRTLSEDELRDMRLWARLAAIRNDPNYTVAGQ